MFFHKKLGWLTPDVISSPTNSCLSPSMLSCSGGSSCSGPRSPPIHKVFRMAGLKPPGAPSVTGEGISSPAPQGIPIVLMSCSPWATDLNPWNRKESAIWKERNIFAKEIPNLSGGLAPMPTPGQPSPCAPLCQPGCMAPLCLTSFPMYPNPCGSVGTVPWATQPISFFPCGTQFSLGPNCAHMIPCTVKIANPGLCATKGENLCNAKSSLASKCASPLSCTLTSPYIAKYANGIPCVLEILPASDCASPCGAEIQYEAKGAALNSPCGTKGANIHPCDVDFLPAPNYGSPTSCGTKGATLIPYAAKGATFTSPCGTKCANFHPCGVETLPSPNCASPVLCATKGVTTIPYATKGATAPCACATKCVSAVPSLPQCACPVPCGTKGAIEVPSTPSWPVLTPCAPNSCYKAPAFTVPQVILKWAGRCGVACPNVGTLSVSQACPPLNTTFAKK